MNMLLENANPMHQFFLGTPGTPNIDFRHGHSRDIGLGG
jgi:hypothetical protein